MYANIINYFNRIFSSCDNYKLQILETNPTEMPPSEVEKWVMVELF